VFNKVDKETMHVNHVFLPQESWGQYRNKKNLRMYFPLATDQTPLKPTANSTL